MTTKFYCSLCRWGILIIVSALPLGCASKPTAEKQAAEPASPAATRPLEATALVDSPAFASPEEAVQAWARAYQQDGQEGHRRLTFDQNDLPEEQWQKTLTEGYAAAAEAGDVQILETLSRDQVAAVVVRLGDRVDRFALYQDAKGWHLCRTLRNWDPVKMPSGWPPTGPLWTRISGYQCPSTVGRLSWVRYGPNGVGTVGDPVPGVENVVLNYFGCMGGGMDEPATANKRVSPATAGSPGGQNCTCGTVGAPLPNARFLIHWTNGFMTVQTTVGLPAGTLPKGKELRDALDGTSNSILAGETIYDNMQLNRGWGVSHRTRHTGNNGPNSITGTYRAINSGRQVYLAFSLMTSDDNLHNHLMNTCFGSQHPGGAQFCMGDGSVRFFNENLSLPIYRTLGAFSDGAPSGGLQF